MRSDHFGTKNCAICLGEVEQLKKHDCSAIRPLFENNVIGFEGEILIPRGYQKVHKECYKNFKGSKYEHHSNQTR